MSTRDYFGWTRNFSTMILSGICTWSSWFQSMIRSSQRSDGEKLCATSWIFRLRHDNIMNNFCSKSVRELALPTLQKYSLDSLGVLSHRRRPQLARKLEWSLRIHLG